MEAKFIKVKDKPNDESWLNSAAIDKVLHRHGEVILLRISGTTTEVLARIPYETDPSVAPLAKDALEALCGGDYSHIVPKMATLVAGAPQEDTVGHKWVPRDQRTSLPDPSRRTKF